MSLSLQDVCNLFDRYGWTYKQIDDQTLLTNFKSKEASRIFTVGARVDQDWLTLTIVVDLPKPSTEREADVHRRLLELNAQISVVRFALNSSSEIILTADLLGEKKVIYDVFATTMDALSFYADGTYSVLYESITGQKQAKIQDEYNE